MMTPVEVGRSGGTLNINCIFNEFFEYCQGIMTNCNNLLQT